MQWQKGICKHFSRNPYLGAMAEYPYQFRQQHTVLPNHLDEMNHVNNVVYVQWAQDVAKAHWRHVGSSLMNRFVWVALRHEIDYLSPAFLHDEVELLTWVGEALGPRFERHIVIRNSRTGQEYAKARTIWCLLDAGSLKPKRIQEEILTAFQS